MNIIRTVLTGRRGNDWPLTPVFNQGSVTDVVGRWERMVKEFKKSVSQAANQPVKTFYLTLITFKGQRP
jgi:hypothetical protein